MLLSVVKETDTMAFVCPVSLCTTAPRMSTSTSRWMRSRPSIVSVLIVCLRLERTNDSMGGLRSTLHAISTLPETSAVNLTIFEGPHNRLSFLVTGEHMFAIFTDRDSCDGLFMFNQNLCRHINAIISSIFSLVESTCVSLPDANSHSLHPQSSPPVIKYCESPRKAMHVIFPSV